MSSKPTAFWIPTKPYSATDCLNRISAATGSVRNAIAAANSNYNGHALTLSWNQYRQYYVGEYFWGERVVLARGTDFKSVLETMIDAFDRGGRGTRLIIHVRVDLTEVLDGEGKVSKAKIEVPHGLDQELAMTHPRLAPHSKEIEAAHDATWRTWQHNRMNEAINWERQLGVPLSVFFDSTSSEDWNARREAFLEARRNRR